MQDHRMQQPSEGRSAKEQPVATKTTDCASSAIAEVAGGCGLASGFQFAGLHCGIKKRRKDLALIVSDEECTVAGMFTSSQVVAPPVRYCKELISSGKLGRAVIINSGNANACTGAQGMIDAKEMAQLTGQALGCQPDQVYVSSTGVIGPTLPMHCLRFGIPAAVKLMAAGEQAALAAAEAILTTDTTAKTCAYKVGLSGGDVYIGGMAKGSGMIAPDLEHPNAHHPGLPHATTLAFLTTDAEIPGTLLQGLLGDAMQASFNCITVDGDTSTNDTVLLLASGASGTSLGNAEDCALFSRALHQAALDLALMVVRDGEGAQRVIEVRVAGARCERQARQVARTVAESPLVKTAFCAGEPNWGRFMMAIGRSGVELAEERLAVSVNRLVVVEGGLGTEHDAQALRNEMTRDDVLLAIDLGEAENATSSIWTCDLSEEYVRINGHYLT